MIYSAKEFERLRTSDDPEEYGKAATEVASEAVWREVIESYPAMRVWVAHNETVPIEILRVLAGDDDAQVRSMVARKRKLDHDLFVALSADSDAGVRHALACNGKCPPKVLHLLASDTEVFVAEEANRRLRG